MSNDVQTIPATDMTEKEQKALQTYMMSGVPGMYHVSDTDIYAWFNLYMAGKGYEEIAEQCKVGIDKVLFIAKKHEWLNKKMNHLDRIHRKIGDRNIQTLLESAAFLTDYIAYIHRKLGKNINLFLAGDLTVPGVSTAELEKYFKAVEALKSLTPKPPEEKTPNVTINTGGGHVTMGDPIAAAIEIKSRPFKTLAETKRAKKAPPKEVETPPKEVKPQTKIKKKQKRDITSI